MKHLLSIAILVFAISCTGESTRLNGSILDNFKSTAVSENSSVASSDSLHKSNANLTDTALHISVYVRCVFEDSKGNLWFGTDNLGVCKYDRKKMVYYNMKNGLSGNKVRSIIEDKMGNIWIATNYGISVFDGYVFTRYTTKNGLPSDEVWSLCIDQSSSAGKGTIWCGTDMGVCKFQPSSTTQTVQFVPFELPAGDLKKYPKAYPAPKLIYSIFQDTKGILWFGTNGAGLFSHDPNGATTASGKSDERSTLIHYTEQNGLCNNVINSIYEDRQGTLWACSRFGGVSMISRTSAKINFTTIDTSNGLSNQFVWSAFEDKTGNLWFATAGGGIDIRFASNESGKAGIKNFSVKNFTVKDGLSNNFVQSVTQSKSGTIWIGTGEGVSRFNDHFQPTDLPVFTSFPNMDGC